MSEIKINRLVLVGNGFDLAHGLKTSFYNFINYCAFEISRIAFFQKNNGNIPNSFICDNNIINMDSLKIYIQFFKLYKTFDVELKSYSGNTNLDKFNRLKDESKILNEHLDKLSSKYDYSYNYLEQINVLFSEALWINHLNNWYDLNNTYYPMYQPSNITNIFNNKLFNHILAKIMGNNTKNWGGIEHDFYQTLLEVDKFYAQNSTRDGIDILNEEFQNIINCFIYYMESIASKQQPQFIPQVLEHIKKTIQKRELNNKLEFLNQKPSLRDLATNTKLPLSYQVNETLFLNFNYTNTIEQYLSPEIKAKHVQIHGKLGNLDNPIIFGYGDELDNSYQELENKNDNRYLKYSKSLHYLLNSNYKDLLTFLEQDMYQVYIWGHSCATSDRVLLQTIFEHENCISIKPFYHKKNDGSDNYTDLITNISRSFTDKKKFRDIVVNKRYCQPLSE